MKNRHSISILFTVLLLAVSTKSVMAKSYDYEINLSEIKKTYEYKTSFDSFKVDYSDGNLEDYYVTDFLFDGVDAVKSYDLDDFVKYVADGGNAPEPDIIGGSVVNINATGDYLLSGTLKKGMIAVNTNGLSGEINIYLDNVTIDTDKKKWPAIYVYNNDINYDEVKVTIIPLEGTKNYITGGKLKKISLMNADSLDSYRDSYNNITYTYDDENANDIKTSVKYNDLASYYGVYTREQMGENYENVLFARVKADHEGLMDGDPTIYYKGSGAISSDVALTFNGAGYLFIKSYNKEGVETKNDLTFAGGIGDYMIYAYDDCLNTTTASTSSAYSTFSSQITIDVKSLYAIVSPDADEGDAIDSNGALIIKGGTIVALAHPYSGDSGLDAEYSMEMNRDGNAYTAGSSGIYINGGTVIATGDMMDTPQNDSKQSYLIFNLNFITNLSSGHLITIVDSNNNPVFSYNTDRKPRYLFYSNSTLNKDVYNLYVDGEISGTENTVSEKVIYYTDITSFTGGTILISTTIGASSFRGEMHTPEAYNVNPIYVSMNDFLAYGSISFVAGLILSLFVVCLIGKNGIKSIFTDKYQLTILILGALFIAIISFVIIYFTIIVK